MGERDILHRQILRVPENFADASGLKLKKYGIKIDPKGLKVVYPYESYLDEKGKNRETIGDMRMLWTYELNGVEVDIALVGIETQTSVDWAMVPRIMRYEAQGYLNQTKDNPRQKCRPVIMIVLYFGEKPWNGPTTLRETIEYAEGTEDILSPLVSDYKIHIVDFHDVTLEEIEAMPSDFRFYATVHYNLLHLHNQVPLPAVKDPELALKYVDLYNDGELELDADFALEKLSQGGCAMNELFKQFIAYEQGVALDQRYEEGREEGRQQERKELAHKLLENGLPSYKIAEILDVAQATVDAWLSEN